MKIYFALFLILSTINLLCYVNREKFTYIPYKKYSSLYNISPTYLQKWEGNIYNYKKEELLKAQQILKESADVNQSDKSSVKAKKIYNFIYNNFAAQGGHPTKEFLEFSPLSKYYALSDTSVKLWCGDYAQLYSFFLCAENLICRNIEIPGKHAFNEIYLPDKRTWQFVDVSDNVFMVFKGNKHYNTVDIIKNKESQILVERAIDTTKAYGKTLKFHKYYEPNDSILIYYTTDLNNQYKIHNKIARYFLPLSFNIVYQENQKSNLPYIIKCILGILWIFSLSKICYILYDRSKKHKEKL